MACRFTYRGKVYDEDGLAKTLAAMPLEDAAKFIPGVRSLPDAPFVGNTEAWASLAFKRMVRFAAENGFDEVAWTPGDVQAERYDLSKHLTSLTVVPEKPAHHGATPSGNTWWWPLMADGRDVGSIVVDKAGKVIKAHQLFSDTVGKHISDVFGKEIAEKGLAVTKDTKFSGLDLKVGGEGMRGFYDRILPSVANKLGKKFGAKVGTGEIDAASHEGPASWTSVGTSTHRPGSARQKIWVLPITPAMRDAAMQGQPLFRTEPESRKVKLSPAKRATIERQASAILTRIAGRGVKVQFEDTIPIEEALPRGQVEQLRASARARGAQLNETIGGFYQYPPHELIAIALNDPHYDPLTTAGHEAWHRARTMLNRAEIAVLGRERNRIAELAATELGMTPENALKLGADEVEANAFQRYRRMKEEGSRLAIFPGPIRTVFEKLFNAFRLIRDMLRRNGVQRYEDVFEKARTGEIAWREEVGTPKLSFMQRLAQAGWHGGPHIFDKFSLEHIGSGEGAQAYGWGLYFSGKKEIAEYYRDTLTRQFSGPRRDIAKAWLDDAKGDTEKAISLFTDFARGARLTKEEIDDTVKAIRDVKARGALYHVDLPEDDTMLLWDKPFNDQPPKVKEALAKVGIKAPEKPAPIKDSALRNIVESALKQTADEDGSFDHLSTGDVALMVNNDQALHKAAISHADKNGLYDAENHTYFGTDEEFDAGEYIEKQAYDYLLALRKRLDATGEKIYRGLGQRLAAPEEAPNWTSVRSTINGVLSDDKAASLALNEAGISGIKYLAGTYRSAGEGDYNYVIFDDNAVKIIERLASSSEAPLDSFARGAEARQQAMQRGFSVQPLDRMLRLPFDIFGGMNAKGEWKPGLYLNDKASRLITTARFDQSSRFAFLNPVFHHARAGLIDRYGLDDAYVARDRRRQLEERSILNQVPELMKMMADKGMGPAEAKTLHAILVGEEVPAAEFAALSEPVRNAIDTFGAEAVELGLISPESFERNRGKYLHRVYLKHENDQGGLSRWLGNMMGTRRKKIIGEELKGRGMWKQVPLDRLPVDGAPKPGEKFIIFDKVNEDGKVTKRVFQKNGTAAPAGFESRGAWEVRGVKSGEIVLWRDYTKEERTKMGEITDARYTIAKTYMLMAHDLATGRFYRDVALNRDWTTADQPKERWIDAADWKRAYAASDLEWVRVPDTTIAKSNAKRWGALAGKWVRAEIWRDINEVEVMNRSNIWAKLLTQWKKNKALALDTPIPTPTGWTTMGGIRVGDEVFDENGKVCSVLEVRDVVYGRPCYEVAFSDGTKIVADEEHWWFTLKNGKGGVRTTAEVLATLKERTRGDHRHSIPVTGALALPAASLPIPPYALGVWLGDGDARSARVSAGGRDVLEVVENLTASGVRCSTPKKDTRNNVYSFTILKWSDTCGRGHDPERRFADGECRDCDLERQRAARRGLPNPPHTNPRIAARLRALGLIGSKHIPRQYLRASREQRSELLQGLMDSDGWVTERGTCGFATSSSSLRHGALELMRSLGFKPSASEIITQSGRPGWRILFQAYSDMPVVRISAKACRLRQRPSSRQRSGTRQIVAITPVPSVPVRCIRVSSQSHLYLAGEGMIPTHNTSRNPVVHMNNVMSNFVLMDMSGVGMADLTKGVRSLLTKDAEYQEANKAGAFGVDMVSQEIRQQVLQPILDDLEKSLAGGTGTLEKRLGALGKLAEHIWGGAWYLDRKMVQAYQLEDELFRMALYHRRRAQGVEPQEAADEARTQFIDYDIRAPWVNMARRSLLPFISYTYRATPLLAKTLATRPWKIGKYALIAYAIGALANYLNPGDEDEERRSMREGEQGNTWLMAPRMIRMPWADDIGNPVYLDIRRWIPAGDIFDMNQSQAAVPVPAPLQFGGPLQMAFEFAMNKQSFTGDPITNELTDDMWERTSKTADWMWKSWMPTAAYMPGSWYWEKIARSVKGGRDFAGKPYSTAQALASSVGVKLNPVDVKENFVFRGFEFKKVEDELKLQMSRLGRDYARGLISREEAETERNTIINKLINLNRNRVRTFTGKELETAP